MSDNRSSAALDAPLPHAPLPPAPLHPPRLKNRLIALIAGSVLVHAGFFAFGAYESHVYEEQHPVVEVQTFQATTTVGDDGEPQTTWTVEGGTHRARITLSSR